MTKAPLPQGCVTVQLREPVFALLKLFDDLRFAEMFRAGKLRLQTLRYFRGREDGLGNRGDRYEGTLASLPHGGDHSILLRRLADGVERRISSVHTSELRVSTDETSLANVLCLYAVRGAGEFEDLEEARRLLLVCSSAERLGPHVAIIKNAQAFIDRFTEALNDSFRRELGEVDYYDPRETLHLERPVFSKRNEYAHQKEIRFAVWRDELIDAPLDLELGDLSDIVELTTVERFNASLEVEWRAE